MTNTISTSTAQKILNELSNKDIYVSCGYGGVLFIEIGTISDHQFEYEEGKKTTRKYGEYRLFCDDTWSFSNDKGLHIDRWTSSSKETDELFASLSVQKLEKIEVVHDFEKIIFHISGGHTLTITRDDSIETFSIVLIPEKKKLTIFGNGTIEFNDYDPDMSHLTVNKPRPKHTETVLLDRNFLRNQAKDLLPLALDKAIEFLHPILNQQIQKIKIDSGTRFQLCFGEDYRKMLTKEQQKVWPDPLYRWSLSIDEIWVLKKDSKNILDVRDVRFQFVEKISSFLEKKHIKAIDFDKHGAATQFTFSDNYALSILETNRYSRWDIHDFLTGLSIGSYRDQGLVYRISPPIHLSDSYKTGDVHLNAILYELDFYRNYVAKSNKLQSPPRHYWAIPQISKYITC